MTDSFKPFRKNPIAYFCAEYALFNHTALYAGGLGVLSGDYVEEMMKENFPTVAIGLFYHKEYRHGLELSRERKTPGSLGLSLAKVADGSILKFPIEINKKKIYIQAWTFKKGDVNIFLLDTQLEENNPEDWKICDNLYDDDRDIRLLQEIVLGVGGMKVLEILDIHPHLYHLNEGHSAFLTFEFIRKVIDEKRISFEKACEFVKKHIVFTNHTLVQAGQELFDMSKVKNIFGDEYANLGFDEEVKMFSMTKLALNMSLKVNAVSKLHAERALGVWNKENIEYVTNGINLERWDILKYYSHKESKRKLIEKIKEVSKVTFDENTILLGWARRFVDYKRPLAILDDVERLKKLANKDNKKIQIVFSSPINETYKEESKLLNKLYDLMNGELKGVVAFIPNYDMEIAKLMVSGCDIWLNTPIVGEEACGTSGMKACLNGVLPLSTSDGWVDEVDISEIGWKVKNDDITKSLLDTLENEILPEYYDNKDKWENRIKKSRNLIIENFSTERMLKEYIIKLYSTNFINKHI